MGLVFSISLLVFFFALYLQLGEFEIVFSQIGDLHDRYLVCS